MKRRIKAKLVRDDIASGLTELDLMVKHDLSLNQLLRLFRELIKIGAITHQDLYERFATYQERTDQPNRRKARRASLSLRLPIHDIMSGKFATLRDISVKGLRVAGVEYRVGDATTFYLPTDIFMNADSLLVVADCRWVSTRNQKNQNFMAGFEFQDLSLADLRTLQRFINSLLLSKSGQWSVSRFFSRT
jgi:hypothetical protein